MSLDKDETASVVESVKETLEEKKESKALVTQKRETALQECKMEISEDGIARAGTFLSFVEDLIADGDPITLSASQVRDLRLALRSEKHGMRASVPLMCKGRHCKYLSQCQIHRVGLDVNRFISKPCPEETYLMHTLSRLLCDELEISETDISPVDRKLISSLVKLDIYERRAEKRLAEDDFITQQPFHVTEDGEIIHRDELHQAVAFEESITRRSMRLLNALVATREQRKKLGGEDIKDLSSFASIMHEKSRQMISGNQIKFMPRATNDEQAPEQIKEKEQDAERGGAIQPGTQQDQNPAS